MVLAPGGGYERTAMRFYTVHLGPAPGASGGEREVALVKEGFCWPAFFFTALWALYQRMWAAAAGLFLATTALGMVIEALALDRASEAVITLGYLVLVGFSANDWRRRALARRGLAEAGVVAGGGLAAAEHRVLEWLASRPAAAGPS